MPGRYKFENVAKSELYEAYLKADFGIFQKCMDWIYEIKYGD